MKKCFLLVCLVAFMSHICSATIIIEIDVKLSQVVPESYTLSCGPTGCIYQWVPGEAHWMTIRAPTGEYIPFVFVIKSVVGEGKIGLKEANSTNPIVGAGIAHPDGECEWYFSDDVDFVRLRLCEGSGEEGLAYVYFTREGNILRVRMLPNAGGFMLSKLILGSPPPPTGDPHIPAERSASTTTESNAELIAPNPFSQSLEVKTSAGETESVGLQLLNANGQNLHSQIYQGGQGAYTLPTEGVPPGFYFLRVQVADRVKVYPVVKID